MKKIKFFGIVSLVVLAAVFTSCSKSNDSSSEISKVDDGGSYKKAPMFGTTDELFAKYIGNYSNITCRSQYSFYQYSFYNNSSTQQYYLLGIKNKHLWFSQFDPDGTLKQTWEDTEETDSVLKINGGYGEYRTFQIKLIYPYVTGLDFYKKTDTGNIMFFGFSGKDDSGNVAYAVFTSNNKSKHIIFSHGNYQNWYDNSVFIENCCYSQAGDTLYVCKEYRYFPVSCEDYVPISSYVPISYEEGITCNSGDIYRDNFKTGKNVWSKYCKAPFDIPTDAKPKYTTTLLDKSTDTWKYKVDMVYYDGTKKEFTITININTGEYKTSV